MQTEKSSGRSLDVETWTRRGNTLVLLPPNFLGAVSLNTSRGRLTQLPGLDGRTSILRSSDRELFFLVGPVLESVSADVKGIDYVRLSSKKGGIAVGFSDVDGEPEMLENVRKELSARRGHGRGCC
ncbi:hypothetical protein PENSPDRAFT_649341 [Peniophora sp. CONT]|nr:hypothetical protein PENSPDRAFT_649341 [Peniophora sp. CONT]